MLKLTSEIKSYIWGGKKLQTMYGKGKNADIVSESWELSVHPDGMSHCEGRSLKEYIDENPSVLGSGREELPILIKFIDAMQNLSVQVHPDDEYARAHEGDNGKTEMWYIIDADEGAGIYCGFKRDTDKDELLKMLKLGRVEELLNFIPVKAGDAYLIEAGTVHAICSGCVICEVQESSNVTYRVYDYNRVSKDGTPRPLHIDKALDVINFRAYSDCTNSGECCSCKEYSEKILTSCKYFTCKELDLHGEHLWTCADSCVALNIICGEGRINGELFAAGDSFFIDCNEQIRLSGNAKIIITTL